MLSLLAHSLTGLAVLLVVLLTALLSIVLLDERSRNRETMPMVLHDGTVVDVAIVYESLLARILNHFFYVWVFTVGKRIYVASNYLKPSAFRHEAQHIQQSHEMGVLVYLWTLAVELWQDGFANSGLEQEARRAARFTHT